MNFTLLYENLVKLNRAVFQAITVFCSDMYAIARSISQCFLRLSVQMVY